MICDTDSFVVGRGDSATTITPEYFGRLFYDEKYIQINRIAEWMARDGRSDFFLTWAERNVPSVLLPGLRQVCELSRRSYFPIYNIPDDDIIARTRARIEEDRKHEEE